MSDTQEEPKTLSEYLSQFLPISQRMKARKLLKEEDYKIIYSKAEKESEESGVNLTETFVFAATEYMMLKQFYAKGEDPKKMIIENVIKSWLNEFDMASEKFVMEESDERDDAQFIATPRTKRLNEILELFENDDRRVKRMVLQLMADSSDYGIKVNVKDRKLLFEV